MKPLELSGVYLRRMPEGLVRAREQYLENEHEKFYIWSYFQHGNGD
ncbi:hypothetical protein LCGC14_1867800 [marine sediment metagenome]|uniref:Uncharacterized protein n=1 Tax=marine sediment metagenome TaxID=412755 RepID=A0A0F9J4M0_9ZZZZ